MSSTLVDTNIFVDLLREDPKWLAWSSSAIEKCAEEGSLAINPIIYAELSIMFPSVEALDEALQPIKIQRHDLPWDAAFLAGKAYLKYRQSGGAKQSPLPDFYIGAHAAVRGMNLLTRDKKRYGTYFPKLKIISPV